tara:strand:+ start:3137 stop:3628 length:492 start_codon:yes stop_codon:yes gene_type:complete
MSRKTAKFHIEVEYEDDGKGDLSTDGMRIVTCESEGDFKGITLAMTTGLAFATEKGCDAKETFQQKLRLLRGTGSALQNCLLILQNDGALTDEDINTTLMDEMGVAIKQCIDTITFGIGKILKITNKEVEEFNKEYSEENLNNIKDEKDRQSGLESDDIEDYL